MLSVDAFNLLPDQAAADLLRECCSSARWAGLVVAGRPYGGLDAVLAASSSAVGALDEADLREALAGHPRLGDRRVLTPVAPAGAAGEPAPGGENGFSGREQAGVRSADEASRAALEAGNAEYERRFGHIYLACATGSSAGDLLGFLRERLGNEPGQEWQVVAAELAKINQIRLRKVLGDQGDDR
jgi:2-oxo-4-hydroxy-4-carboxy-5-ureidoimidazoline decarboxylase